MWGDQDHKNRIARELADGECLTEAHHEPVDALVAYMRAQRETNPWGHTPAPRLPSIDDLAEAWAMVGPPIRDGKVLSCDDRRAEARAAVLGLIERALRASGAQRDADRQTGALTLGLSTQ